MKKASVIAVFLALFVSSFSFVGAVNSKTQGAAPEASAPILAPTKWELLGLMQKNTLQPGTYEASFSEEEINGLIDAELSALNVKWFADKAFVKIGNGFVDISLHVLRPFKGDMTARGVVVVNDGKASVKISSAYYGFFPVPASFIERTVNFVLKKKSSDEWLAIRNAEWDNITFKKGEVTFKLSVPEEK